MIIPKNSAFYCLLLPFFTDFYWLLSAVPHCLCPDLHIATASVWNECSCRVERGHHGPISEGLLPRVPEGGRGIRCCSWGAGCSGSPRLPMSPGGGGSARVGNQQEAHSGAQQDRQESYLLPFSSPHCFSICRSFLPSNLHPFVDVSILLQIWFQRRLLNCGWSIWGMSFQLLPSKLVLRHRNTIL